MKTEQPRIAFFSLNAYKVFAPDSQAAIGGSEVQMVLLARQLSAKGYPISFLVGNFGQPSHERLEGMKILRTIKLTKNFRTYASAPWLLWWRLYQSGAEVVISSPAGPEVGLIALYCRLFGKHYIFRTASHVDCTYEKIHDLGLVAGFFYALGLKLVHTIVVQSEESKAALWKYHRRKSVVIHNLIEQPTFQVIPTTREYVLWVGSARTVKQPELFLELALQAPSIKFAMILSRVGDVPLWEAIREKAQKLPNMHFIGEVSLADVQTYMKKARLLVGTSSYEGWPNVYMQAAACGVPIVSLVVNPDDFLTRYGVGLACHNSFDELVTRVTELQQGGDVYNRMVQAGPSYIARVHATDTILALWDDLCQARVDTLPAH